MKISQIIREQQDEDNYENAGKNAPEEVQQAVERWRSLSDEEKAAKPLLYWLLGSGTPDYKMSKREAGYVDNSEDPASKCGNCEFQYLKTSNKHFICSQISGEITPNGHCKLWKKGK